MGKALFPHDLDKRFSALDLDKANLEQYALKCGAHDAQN